MYLKMFLTLFEAFNNREIVKAKFMQVNKAMLLFKRGKQNLKISELKYNNII